MGTYFVVLISQTKLFVNTLTIKYELNVNESFNSPSSIACGDFDYYSDNYCFIQAIYGKGMESKLLHFCLFIMVPVYVEVVRSILKSYQHFGPIAIAIVGTINVFVR